MQEMLWNGVNYKEEVLSYIVLKSGKMYRKRGQKAFQIGAVQSRNPDAQGTVSQWVQRGQYQVEI